MQVSEGYGSLQVIRRHLGGGEEGEYHYQGLIHPITNTSN